MNYKNFCIYSREFLFGKKDSRKGRDQVQAKFLWAQIFNDNIYKAIKSDINMQKIGKVAYNSGAIIVGNGYELYLSNKIEVPKGTYEVTFLCDEDKERPLIRLNYTNNKNPVAPEKMVKSVKTSLEVISIIDADDFQEIRNSDSRSQYMKEDAAIWRDLADEMAVTEYELCEIDKMEPANTPVILTGNPGDGRVDIVYGLDKSGKITEIYIEVLDKDIVAGILSEKNINL